MSLYAPAHRARLTAEILERVGAGETLKGICREAGMPSGDRVRVWARDDPTFGAALAAARSRAEWRRWARFDEAAAAAFVARLAAGERMEDLFKQPGMPTRKTYRYWRSTQGEFQEALWRLRQARYQKTGETQRARLRPWDAATADRITLAVMRGAALRPLLISDPTLPGQVVVTRWRREQPDWDAALRGAVRMGRRARAAARSRCTPELADEITDRVIFGATLSSLGREPDMPAAMTLYRWVKQRPELRRRLSRALEIRELYLTDLMLAHGRAGSQNLQAKIDRLARRRLRREEEERG